MITSAYGPRNNGGRYQIHYGIDLNRPGGGQGDTVYASFLAVVQDCGTGGSDVGHSLHCPLPIALIRPVIRTMESSPACSNTGTF